MASLGIGQVLQGERLRQNIGLDEISRRTCIAPRFIEAIEDEEFSRLPAMVFARGFVRQYSNALNLDPVPLLAVLPRPDIESAPLPDPPPKPGRTKWDPRIKSAVQTALFLIAAIGAGTVAWARFNPRSSQLPYFSFDVWRIVGVRAGSKAATSAATPRENPQSLSPQSLPPDAPALVVESSVIPEPPMTEQMTEEHRAVPSASPSAIQPVEVTVSARDIAWVELIADGKSAFTGMLHPGDVRTVGANGRVKVLAGNAGGVDILLNGKKLDPLGPPGQVRSVTLTSDGPRPAAQTPPLSPGQL